MRPTGLLATALLLTSACSAWPSDWNEALALVRNLAKRQQQSTSFNLSFSSGVQGNTATTQTTTQNVATTTGGNAITNTNEATTGSGSGNNTASPTETNNGNGTVSSSPSVTAFDPRLPPGGVSMINPAATTTTFYKIEDEVTFAWNYTSVSLLPSAIDILAVGAQTGGVGAAPTYTLALNQSVSGNQGTFTWNTSDYQETASVSGTLLRTNQYTLVIHDSSKDISAVASAGYLDTQATFTFGMYLPSPYTPYANWKCPTCSGAMTTVEKQTIAVVMCTAGITVFSFTWFAGVAGLW